ncbi:hypothetical protein [Streptomyces sp. NPDC058653]|uniref:hypothetical protein n=1 Tax=Streptomyces sp. NPDC058653 TaxID=3346576 RepID=UPI00366644BD
MTLEFRPTDKPHCFDLTEGEEQVGELIYFAPEEEGDKPYWRVTLWSVMGTGKEWSADVAESHDGAVNDAHELYKDLVAERRELSRGGRPWTISTPTGGQPKS